MMFSRVVFVILLTACVTCPPLIYAEVIETNFVVRALFNEGYASTHRKCTEAEFYLVRDTILDITESTRHLRAKETELTINCAKFCLGYNRWTCYTLSQRRCTAQMYLDDDDDWDRRDLEERPPRETTFAILDKIFYNDDDETIVTEGRNLVLSYNVTEEQCNAQKAVLYQRALSTLSDISTECANLLLAPSLLQCIIEI